MGSDIQKESIIDENNNDYTQQNVNQFIVLKDGQTIYENIFQQFDSLVYAPETSYLNVFTKEYPTIQHDQLSTLQDQTIDIAIQALLKGISLDYVIQSCSMDYQTIMHLYYCLTVRFSSFKVKQKPKKLVYTSSKSDDPLIQQVLDALNSGEDLKDVTKQFTLSQEELQYIHVE
ncbi:Hypothetical_protein [Hexamita inflata]|uniref:Hypothetical_protein n=1 Tax=Hexamita inflata TaxID=28002 RepID=A0AA86RGL4_9EUKA|nr:Hypothetical protein HINF_LOCUS65779 [Hexamita inflata]